MLLFTFLAGLAFLIIGAELLVRGASRLATALGIPSLIIGLTVVALGTSAPEFAVSIKASLSGQEGVVVGNVIGSNILNVLFILGLSAMIMPLFVSRQLVRYDVPLMIGVSFLAFFLAIDGTLSALDGALLFAGLVAYTLFLIRLAINDRPVPVKNESDSQASDPAPAVNWLQNGGFIIAGLALLIFGSRWLVDSATIIAEQMGVSQLVIGLTVVAAGTSLPEVVTSIVASFKGERDIAVGNVVGSNLFNLLGVLGLASIVAPHGIAVSEPALSFDFPIMIAVAVACLPIFFTGGTISRWEGLVLFCYYIAYTVYIVLSVRHKEWVALLGEAMIYFIIPLTAITLLVISLNALRRKK